MKVKSGAFFFGLFAEGLRALDEPFREVIGDVERELPGDDRDARRGRHWASLLFTRAFCILAFSFRVFAVVACAFARAVCASVFPYAFGGPICAFSFFIFTGAFCASSCALPTFGAQILEQCIFAGLFFERGEELFRERQSVSRIGDDGGVVSAEDHRHDGDRRDVFDVFLGQGGDPRPSGEEGNPHRLFKASVDFEEEAAEGVRGLVRVVRWARTGGFSRDA